MFKNWGLSIFFFLSASIVFTITELVMKPVYKDFGFILFCFSLLYLLITAIYHFSKGRWVVGLLTGFMFGFGMVSFVLYAVLSFFITQFQPDTFADDLTIPKGVKLYEPIGSGYTEARADTFIQRDNPDFVLYKSFQPGIYEYDLWVKEIGSGSVYLKAYEITKGTPLSADRLLQASAINVSNSGNSLKKFSTSRHFTIYEGDWDKPYAARFEVWFKADNKANEEKIFEKNYLIEGWQH